VKKRMHYSENLLIRFFDNNVNNFMNAKQLIDEALSVLYEIEAFSVEDLNNS
jgi:hypothetical protein